MLIFLFSLVFCLSTSLFAGYDESRQYARYSRGDGAPLSELRRPGKAHLNWEGFKMDPWSEGIDGSIVQERNYMSAYGFLNEKWYGSEVIQENIVRNKLSKNSYEAENWLELQILDYEKDPTRFRLIHRNEEDPYWHAGMIRHWKEAEPGSAKVRRIDQKNLSVRWNEALPNWSEATAGPNERPINSVQHTSQLRDWYFS